MKTIKIAAFGALNQDSYDAFDHWLSIYCKQYDIDYDLKKAGPYPNAEAVTVAGRPLRGDALKDAKLKDDLLKAVADDAKSLGDDFDYYCMPCLSMVGFHDGVEKHLTKDIVRLADAIKNYYHYNDKIGVINMRPAEKRIDEIFGDKAFKPSDEFKQKLVDAESAAKSAGNSKPIEIVMSEICKQFADQDVRRILFARADAPHAQINLQNDLDAVVIDSYFQILAESIIRDAIPDELYDDQGEAVA